MGTPVTPSDTDGGVFRYTPPYSVEQYIRLHIQSIDARRFGFLWTGEAFVMRADIDDKDAVFAVWFKS